MSSIGQPWLLKRPLPAPSLDLNFLATTLDPRITFTRAAAATYFDSTGTLQTAGTNVPRFDYDPVTHAPRGLLIEEARTNLLLNSAVLSTQSVTTTAAATTLSFYGTGSVALSGTFTGNLVGTGAFPARVSLTFTPTAGVLTCTVTGSVIDAQVETGAFATSAILSAGTAGVRAVDVATVPVGTWFNAAAGSLEFEYDTLRSSGAPGVVGGMAKTGDFNNSCYFVVAGVNAIIGGVGVPANPTSAIFPGSNKQAASYASGGLLCCNNGASVASAVIGVGPFPWVNVLWLGDAPWGGGNPIDGHIRRVRYWPRALGAQELQGAAR